MPTGDDLRFADYGAAERHCDVVMKGGITSGVVYPQAVCELARDYRFKCVGGTSAGAIAAAATAAAEYGRDGGGFNRLAELPDKLGEAGRLQSLFQPQRSTRRLFKVLIGALDHGGLGVFWAALTGNFLFALLGAAPGAAVLLFSILRITGGTVDVPAVIGCAVGVVGIVLGVLAAVVLRLGHVLFRHVPDNGFGVCSGAGGEGTEHPALTPWLTALIDESAGLDQGDGPLTFGHLWAGPGKDPAKPPPQGARFVELEMMTTNLVNRVGKRIPWTDGGWYFDPTEFRELFPEPVVRHMEEHPRSVEEAESPRESEARRAMMLPRLPMPAPKDLPVVVAARMSLSFPVLLSAVPLWAFDFERPATAKAEEEWRDWLAKRPEHWRAPDRPPADWGYADLPPSLEPERCWFSDGGISSNFPIHFFDSLVPGRPTFGINLRPFPLEKQPDPEDQTKNVWMATDNRLGFKAWWYRLPARPRRALLGDPRLASFLVAAVRTMQNRMDETQMRAPGYRDRIAHVEMDAEEGGMNLTMPPQRIRVLSERGRDAAALLRDAYTAPWDDPDRVITWDNHRWVRLRSALAALEQMHTEFAEGYEGRAPGTEAGRTYAELVERKKGVRPTSYPLDSETKKDRAAVEVAAMLVLGDGTDAKALTKGAPRPRPEGRVVPKQ